MSSFIFDNRNSFSEYHYIRKAGSTDYWFDIRVSKLKTLQDNFGDDFCIIIFGSETTNDTYVIPFSQIKELFIEENLYKNIRWMGSIVDGTLRIRNSSLALSIAEYYNAFEWLRDKDDEEQVIKETKAVYDVNRDVELADILQKINAFNKSYENAQPRKRITISEQIARPNVISDYVKKLQNYKCQICFDEGFLKNSGKQYAEAHHIVELHNLVPGSYCSDNIIVVCPTCHRKLHYAKVEYFSDDSLFVKVEINDTPYNFTRNIIAKEI